MASDSIESLDELLRALAMERNLRGRLRVIGRAWGLLKQLSPIEREKVALRMGSTWAWKRLEKSFLGDGELSENEALIGQILGRMGDADPKELREMARAVRSGDRAQMKDLLMLTLQEALDEEAEDEAALDPFRVSDRDTGDFEELALEEAPAVVEAADTPPRLPPEPEPAEPEPKEPVVEVVQTPAAVFASSAAQPVARPQPDASPPVARPDASPPVARPRPDASPPVARPRPDASPPVARPRPDASPPAAPLDDSGWWAPLRRPVKRTPVESAKRAMPLAQDSQGRELSGRERLDLLRKLHREARPGASLDPAERAKLIGSLGGGWASHRALSCILRGGGVSDLDEALGLIGRLARPMQQARRLADLLERNGLTPDEIDRIVSAAPSAAGHRRLASRARKPKGQPPGSG